MDDVLWLALAFMLMFEGLFPLLLPRSWRETFEDLGVSVRECDKVATAFRRAADIGMRDVERCL